MGAAVRPQPIPAYRMISGGFEGAVYCIKQAPITLAFRRLDRLEGEASARLRPRIYKTPRAGPAQAGR